VSRGIVVTAPPKLLLVEDEPALVDSLSYHLVRDGFDVHAVGNGEAALENFRSERPVLVILDLMLPGMSGLDVCRAIRAESQVPILILTALDSEADKVTSLELGADDYVTKPFSMRELVSRIRAHLRRAGVAPVPVTDGHLEGGPVRMDPYRHEVLVREEPIALTPKEFDLLQALLKRKGRMLARRFLIDEVWGPAYFGDTKTLDVHVKRLRKKIEPEPHRPRHILTVRGLGYKFVE
jgi:two-component system, OmpR family, response regulator RegX3